MKRRTFLKTTSAIGLGTALPWSGILGRAYAAEGFPTTKSSGNMLFPRPADGAAFDLSPVGLAWLPCPGADRYRVEIYDPNGAIIHSADAGGDPVHCPDRVLPAGTYHWDVIALDETGTDIARRGRKSFRILPGATPLPWVEPSELLRRVPTEHPRILFPKSELDAIRATLSTTRKASWTATRAAAERALTKGVPEFPVYHKIDDPATQRMEYQKYFGYFRGFVDSALMDLSLAFLMSEEDKYAAAAKRILLEIASWPTDDADVSSVSARWGDEIGLSFSKCAHIAYDWLYPALDTRERALVSRMCRERAGQTFRRLKRKNYLTYPGESHDGRLIAYLTDMSLALAGEAEEAETWLTYSLKAMLTFYPHWGGIDGGWAEGAAYGLWYNTFYIPAFEGLRQLTGMDLWQRSFFKNIRHFFFYCTANHGEIRPFGDSAEKGGPGVGRGSGYAELMAFHAHRFNDPAVGWWVTQIPGYRGGSAGALSLLHPDELPAQPPTDIPHARAFTSVGWAGLHDNLADPENDTCLIFKSSPYGSVSHSHADQNAFAIMKGGVALAIPSGYYGPSYGKPHHAEWTRSTKANNCVLVNGQGQTIRSADATGAIVDFKDTPGYAWVVGDATPAYMGKLEKCIRSILFLRPGLFLLLDELEARTASRFQWMLHAFEEMVIDGNTITSKRGNATLDVYLAGSKPLALSQTNRFDTPFNEGIPEAYHQDVDPHWHVQAETSENAGSVRIAAVMSVYNEHDPQKVIIRRQPGWFGATVEGAFGAVEGWIRTGNSDDAPPKGVTPETSIWGRTHNDQVFSA